MRSLLSRISVNHQKPIAVGLLVAAAVAALSGAVTSIGWFVKSQEKCKGHLVWKECRDIAIPLGDRVPFLLVSIGLVGVAVFCVLASLWLLTLAGRLKRYLAILTGIESITVQQIADITHFRPSRVRNEIQTMIDSDMISDFYIDYGADRVISRRYIPKTSHKTVLKCSECGGNNELIVGITRHCGFCGQPLMIGTT